MSNRIVLFVKSKIPEGARWITVHPHGAGEKGQPILIQPNPDGSAHVIGGAGGSLNYLKLRNVRKESDYQKEAEEKRVAKTEAKKEQRKKDKAAGLVESKKKAREEVRVQRLQKEGEFVRTVADALGWEADKLKFDEEKHKDLTEAATNKARNDFHGKLLKEANAAVELQRQNLLMDAGTRMQAGIQEVPLESKDPNVISVEDLNPIPANTGGLGFSADYKERAEAQASPDELKAETAETKERKQSTLSEGQRQGVIRRGELAGKIKEELKSIRDPLPDLPKPSLVDANKAMELLRASKALKKVQKDAQSATREIDKSAVEPKAYLLEYEADPDLDAKVAEDLANDLKTIQTRAFLSEFKRSGGDSLGKYLGIGAYNSINSLALAVGGDALVDRSVVDVLGVAGAAQVLARRVRADLSPEQADKVAAAVQDFHLNTYMDTSSEALGRAKELMDAAREAKIGEMANGSDLMAAQELNVRRQKAIKESQRILGESLGEMEANAALVLALGQQKSGDFQVSMGKAPVSSVVNQARALGLQRGDYRIDFAGGNTFMTVTEEGMLRLAKPVNKADIAQVQSNLAIIQGHHDEDGWLPEGVARRPDLVMNVKPGVAPRLAEPFAPGDDLHQSLQDYIGGRAADGDSPADILVDIQSADFMRKAGDRQADYRAALDKLVPLHSQEGGMQRVEALAGTFDEYADQYVSRKFGGERAPINRQKFNVDQKAADALHRALAETPEGTAAYKPIGELEHGDQRALREFFHQHVVKESPEAASMRGDLDKMGESEPEKESVDMFGETTTNPDWTEWNQRRTDLSAKVSGAALTWPKYVEGHGGPERAYEAIQDVVRSRVGKSFANVYNTLNPDSPIKTGKTVIRNNLTHLDMVDPAAREQRQAEQRAMVDSLRERNQGRYAGGSVSEKLDESRAAKEAFEQSQMGFFSSEATPPTQEQELRADERVTVGHAAERQIAGMMGIMGNGFKPGKPTKIFQPSMSGGKNAARQRLVKMMESNKRVVAAFGTGSGKTLLQIGSFAHLHEKGKAKRGLFLLPSIVQGQFGGEATRFLEPGKFNWHIQPGASQAERIAAYKDPKHNFVAMTHSSFRDDMLHLGAKHAGVAETEMAAQLQTMSPADRKQWMRGIMDAEGIDFDFLSVDESQNVLNRAGKENSSMANVVDAVSAHTPYYMSASGDPIKNDASEIFDVLRKMDPDRYTDRGAFMRRYGADTIGSKDALRREMARYIYPSKIDPDVKADRQEVKYSLSDGQKLALAELDKNVSSARMARMQGKVDIPAMRAISPESFEGVADDQHEGIAKDLQQSMGIMRASAIQRVISTHPDNPGIDKVSEYAKTRTGKPGIVFAHSLAAVKMLTARLEKEGHRVVTLTGADSAGEKERKRLMFNPESGEAKADILIASDAGATGMNAQRGQWVYQYDVPQTAMVHAQRNGRVFRVGQKNDVELADGVADHPEVAKARDRVQRKYGLRDLMTSSLDGLDESGIAYYLKQRDVYGDESKVA